MSTSIFAVRSVPARAPAAPVPLLADRAYAAFESGQLEQAAALFAELLESPAAAGELADCHYMLGLACKYLGRWPQSLQHNLQAQALRDGFDEASSWNAGIAATALGDWQEARRQWAACGLEIPDGDGPIVANFGITGVRLNPAHESETLFARRIDPARAQLINVPLPESGYRYGDIVLHDGAATGSRPLGSGEVPVFNVLARLQTSGFRTWTAFVRCEGSGDADVLAGGCGPGIGAIEDWTQSISHWCLRCSRGEAHDHDHDHENDRGTPAPDDGPQPSDHPGGWDPMRTFGIAAQSRRAVEKLLRDWKNEAPGRSVQGIESQEHAVPAPLPGLVWWRLPD